MAIAAFVWYLVSLIVSVALAPKPPKPKAAAIEDFDLPTAELDRPLPVLFGTKRITGANVLWYGDLANTRIKQRTLFSSTTVGFRYYLGIHFGCMYGPADELSQIEVGEKVLWSGSVTANGNIDVSEPELFGGDKKEGGMAGRVAVMMGGPTQAANSYLASVINSPMPAFRGMAGLVWERGGVAGDGYIGNTPYPKPWAITWTRILAGWEGGNVWYSTKAAISDAMNPAHIVYQVLTDTRFGEGTIPAQINTESFEAAADVLFDEGFGLNLLWNQSTLVDDFLTIVIQHIGGALAIDPANNQYVLLLFRDDYDIEDLDEFGVSEIERMDSLQTQTWGETVNELVVTYTDPETLKGMPITVQDLANIRNQGGVVSERLDRSGITDNDLIVSVAGRELAQRSTPLWRARFTANRQFWDKTIGDVFKLTWPRPVLQSVVMRVIKSDAGALEEGSIPVEAVQDIYSLTGLNYSVAQSQGSAPVVPDTPADDDGNPNVLAADLSAPPSGPADGDRYLIPLTPAAEDEWDGHEGDIAEWDEDLQEWVFIDVPVGSTIYNEDTGDHLLIDESGATAYNPIAAGGNPEPTLTSTAPASIDVDSTGVLLTVDGTGFTFWTVATWEGQPLATQWLSSTQLEVTVPAELLDTVGLFGFSVVNPPPGGGASNELDIPVASPSWSPALTTTTLWLDASDNTTFTLDGSDNVSEWRDKSGNDNHMAQATSSSRPARVASGVEFDNNPAAVHSTASTTEFLERTGNLLSGYPFTAFAVVDDLEQPGALSIHGVILGGSQNNTTQYALLAAGGEYGARVIHRNTTTRQAAVAFDWGTDRHLLRGLFESANRVIEVDADTNASQGSASTDLSAAGNTYVGVERLPTGTWPAQALAGVAREIVLIVGAVTTDTQEKMEGYLAHKWAINDQLPDDHPYADSPPEP